MRVEWIALVMIGCGRIGFAPIDSHALAGDIAPAELVDLTAGAPLLATPAPTSGSCGQYLMSFQPGGLAGDKWRPTIVDLGETMAFLIPCKHDDSGIPGWGMGLAHLDATIDPPTASWFDADLTDTGITELYNAHSLTTSGVRIGEVANLAMATDGTQLFGVGANYYTGVDHDMPVSATSLETLAATDYDLARAEAFDLDANDGTWRGGHTYERSMIYRDGAFQLFAMQIDAPASTTNYIVVHRSVTGADVELATAPLLTGYADPVVAQTADHVYLIAIDAATSAYVLFAATTIDGLATATPIPLDLGRFQGPVGRWNHDLYAYDASGEPRIIGAWIHASQLYLFYLAGVTDYTVASAPYSAPRAIGMLRAPLH